MNFKLSKIIKYKDSVSLYGTDKPDLRNPLIIKDVTDCFANSGFKIFEYNIKKGFVVKAIKAPGSSIKPRGWFDKLNDWARDNGQKGLGYIIFENNEFKGPIAKNLKEENLNSIKDLSNLENGDSIFFISDDENNANKFAAIARNQLCNELNLLEKNTFKFCWIVDFPMFELDPQSKKIDFSHNPFSMPQGDIDKIDFDNPLEILAYQYDIVCNGIELSSGAIRNHIPELMYKLFSIAGYDKNQVDQKFSGMINALNYGAPPHGGIAPGLDRIVMLLANEKNIREVTMFPMNQNAQDLMMNAPSEVSNDQLKELNISLKMKK